MEALEAMSCSEDKKKYIVSLLNPLLEEMVAEVIHKMPNDPMPFMLEFLEAKKVGDEDKLLGPEEKDRLTADNTRLRTSLVKVKTEVYEAAQNINKDAQDEESEEEDDEDEEPPPEFFKTADQIGRARASVSAEAYGEWNKKKAFVAPVIPKTEEQKQRLKDCLSKSFLFSTLEDKDMTVVIGAMKEVIADPHQRVITQGDQGDFLCVIESGKLDCIIKVDGTPKVVKTCEAGDVFGELALLYNCPRAASVDAVERCVIWQLDRDTFNNIVKDAAQKKRERYDIFLSKVPILTNMSAYERSQLADALQAESVADAAAICKEGEPGSKFYFVEEGEAIVTKGGQNVMSYGAGDYFGELALIKNQPRAATVVAKGATKLLSLESRSFKRLLNVQDLLERSSKYA